jgi:NADPH:quinone reductase-like Zn-dependent oxidoreductase
MPMARTDPTDTMTAAVTIGHGGPHMVTIRHDWPTPTVGPSDVLVRVMAAALNNTDVWSREGAYGTTANPAAVVGWKGVPLTFPLIQGIDIAGIVEAVGVHVDRAWIGRRVLVDPIVTYTNDFPSAVIGSEANGGFAQLHACPVERVYDVSGSPLSDAQLASLPTAFGTALGLINRAKCRAGERVLVTGASGGVGGAAIQLLLDRGCQVVARTSPSKAAAVEAMGVAALSVRGVHPLSDLAYEGAQVDAVIDVVGGEEFNDLIDCLRIGGRLATAGAIAGPVVSIDVRRLYLNQRSLIGSTMHTPQDFAELARIATAGGMSPHVDDVYPLTQFHEAQRRFEAKTFIGKLVVAPN